MNTRNTKIQTPAATTVPQKERKHIMYKLKNSLIAVAGLTVLIGLMAAITPSSSQGQGVPNSKDKDVTVVNIPSNPVPVLVQGMTKVMVSSPVQIGNTASEPIPVSPQGVTRVEGTVNLGGPVLLQTSPRAPMFFSQAILPENIFQHEITVILQPDDEGEEVFPSELDVPHGKLLWLDFVSADIHMGNDGQIPKASLIRKHPPQTTSFLLQSLPAFHQGGAEWVIGTSSNALVQDSVDIGIRFIRTSENRGVSGQATLTIALTGHFMDVP